MLFNSIVMNISINIIIGDNAIQIIMMRIVLNNLAFSL